MLDWDLLWLGWRRVLGHGAALQAGDEGLPGQGQGRLRQLGKGRGKLSLTVIWTKIS